MTFSVTEVDAIFAAALELSSPEERTEYVQRVCGENAELRQRVEELLAAHFRAGEFLERPPVTLLYGDGEDIQAGPGTIIGPYKLLQQIGEGGMGVVFMAEQAKPIQRTVALKIIKPGMDTRQVIARFEAERQALAMMDHPSISKVLDAGTTETGRPYFVMELVKGVPITKYCDEHKLSLRQRLELFKPVCEAVQHAHQKGIIHRDIKPTNVLVAEYDNRAVPKIIDFGVAKATAQKLTERTMFTEFGQVIGTVEYMSPEQAKLNQLDIDTRSDIYSLGVLLYELLAGSTPFEQKQLREAAFDEVLRIIREEEPPTPSTRLSTGDTLPSIAANRHTEPARLRREVRGELDWMVMKCLEKDRNRRYQTAAAFAEEIHRYLNHEPVEAGPHSTTYRLRKFAWRRKTFLTISFLVLLALYSICFIATLVNLLHQADEQTLAFIHEGTAHRGEQLLTNLHRAAAEDGLAWLLVTSAAPQERDPERAIKLANSAVLLAKNAIADTGSIRKSLGDEHKVVQQLRTMAPPLGDYHNTLGVAQYRAGKWQAAIEELDIATNLHDGGNAHDEFFLAMAHWQLGHKDDARKCYDKAVEWMAKNQPKNPELLRFRAEAAELLGISQPPSTKSGDEPQSSKSSTR